MIVSFSFCINRYTDNKVFIALSHGELCVFHRDMSNMKLFQ